MNGNDPLQLELQRLRLELDNARLEITLLRQKLDLLSRKLFGQKSEHLDPNQLQLLLGFIHSSQAEEPAPEPQKAERRKPQKKSGKFKVRYPEDLEVVENILIPSAVEENPLLWKEISREVHDQLDFTPERFFIHRTIRPKYILIGDQERPPVVEPAPARIIEGGLASTELLTQILISKYCDHLPFYRQEQIFLERHQVWIPRQLMVQWAEKTTDQLKLVVVHMREEMLKKKYLQADETPLPYLDPNHPNGRGTGYLWTYLDPGVQVIFEWHPTREGECLNKFLKNDFKGILQSDGYAAYAAFAREQPEVELAGCWAHTRRKFFDAKEQAPKVVGWILTQIGLLYHFESQYRTARAGPVLREVHRQGQGRLVVNRLRSAFLRLQGRYLPQSLLGKAIAYALNQWEYLDLILNHGEVELDTNLVENAIRPTALGKKNFLFIGHKDAGDRSAILYTLVQTCRIQGIDPRAYLKDVLQRLPSMTNQTIAELTPVNWAKNHKAAIKSAA